MDKENKNYFIYGMGLGGVLIGLAAVLGRYTNPPRNMIPRNEHVQQGFIAPSKLEIECHDFDGDGEPETRLIINNISYSLKEVDNKPVLLPNDSFVTGVR